MVPLSAVIVTVVIALITYAVLMRPGKVRLDDKMAGLAQSLMDDPDFLFVEDEKVDVKSF